MRPKATAGIPGTVHGFNGEALNEGAEPAAQATQMDALGHFAFLREPWDGKPPYPAGQLGYYGGHTQADVKPGVLVPAAAIVERDGKDVAFAMNGDTVQQRAVKLGRSLGDDREVLEGLGGGDAVVLDPPEQLADGSRVRLAREESPSEANDE